MDELHPPDTEMDKTLTEVIPTSPNKFALLSSEDAAAPVENQVVPTTIDQSTLNDLVAAVGPLILAGLQGNAALAKGAPSVHSDMRNGRRSRNPRIAMEEEQRNCNKEKVEEPKESNRKETVHKEQEAEQAVALENEAEEMAATSRNTGGKKKHKKSSKAKSDGQSHGTSNDEEAIIENAKPGTPKGNEQEVEDTFDHDAEASGRLSRSEKKNGGPNKRKKSKSRSRSRPKKKDDTPFYWEDGIDDDPGIAQ